MFRRLEVGSNGGYVPQVVEHKELLACYLQQTDGSLSQSTTSVGEREKTIGFDCIVAKSLSACKEACMSAEQEDLLEMATADLCACVMKYEGVTMQEALHTVYRSRLYGMMQNPKMLLYRESGHYLYDMLCEERGVKSRV